MPSENALSKNVVGPNSNTKTNSRMAVPRFSSLSRRTPLFTPATADSTDKAQNTITMTH